MKQFKNIIVYQLAKKGLTGMALSDVPSTAGFTPCGPTQAKSVGFVPPRGEAHGALCEVIDGHHIYALLTEVRNVPGQAVAKRAEELASVVEQSTGRRPGRKHMKELREQAVQDLMPSVIPRQSATMIWIDRKAARMVVGTGSAARAEEAAAVFVGLFHGLVVSLVQTEISPAQAMTTWLLGDEPDEFMIGRQLMLVAQDEMHSSVRYDKHPLALEEVRSHITRGKVPTKLALTYGGRIDFVLTHDLAFKQIRFGDVSFADAGTTAKDASAAFDASVAIYCGEMRAALNALIGILN